MIFKAVEVNTNEVSGHAELNAIDLKNRCARICRLLIGNPTSRNKGYGKAIIQALLHIGFIELIPKSSLEKEILPFGLMQSIKNSYEVFGLKLHRLDLGVYDFNKYAIKCYEACGFEIEGLLKENIKVGEGYWSTYNMSLLSPDSVE